MLTLYGIRNCSTMKKAMNWLDEQDLDWELHDYRKAGIDSATLEDWLARAGRETLVNRRGMTWRKLSEEEKAGCTDGTDPVVARVLAEHPTLIKRPVLPAGDQLLVGFDTVQWQSALKD